MKKRFFWGLCAVCLIAALALAGCSSAGATEETALPPQTSETEHSSVLPKSEAMKMYEEAVAAGYEGGYLSFLKEYLSYGNGADNNIFTGCDTLFTAAGVDGAALSAVSIHSTFNIRRYSFTTTSVPAGV